MIQAIAHQGIPYAAAALKWHSRVNILPLRAARATLPINKSKVKVTTSAQTPDDSFDAQAVEAVARRFALQARLYFPMMLLSGLLSALLLYLIYKFNWLPEDGVHAFGTLVFATIIPPVFAHKGHADLTPIHSACLAFVGCISV